MSSHYCSGTIRQPRPAPRQTSRPAMVSRPRPATQRPLWPLTGLDEEAIARLTAYRDTPKVHLPKWRVRFAIAVRLFPILWVLPRCSAPGCGKHWPCRPLLKYLRDTHGWTGSIAPHVKALSTKRRRIRAAARNPTAISHRSLAHKGRFRRPRKLKPS